MLVGPLVSNRVLARVARCSDIFFSHLLSLSDVDLLSATLTAQQRPRAEVGSWSSAPITAAQSKAGRGAQRAATGQQGALALQV